MQKKYPFKFLDAYTQGDQDIFFGREEETAVLYQMVQQSSLVLVYGASGTGKTSLIQCGLAGRFADYEWRPLHIRRGQDINRALEKALAAELPETAAKAEEPYAWLDDIISRQQGAAAAVVENALLRQLRAVYQQQFTPVYLIFDQFEELYILGGREEQAQLIQSVQEILGAGQPVTLIFSIREEYLGHLYEFEKAVPQLLRKKLRVEAMNLDKVRQVMRGIADYPESLIDFEDSHAFAEALFHKIRGKEQVLSIQLPYMQVLLDKLYLQITANADRQQPAHFTTGALEQMASFDDVLRGFLNEQVGLVDEQLRQTGRADYKSDAAWLVLSEFATLEGTKQPLPLPALYQRLEGELPEAIVLAAVEAFEQCRLLRYDSGQQRYELVHDTLAREVAARRKDEKSKLLEVERLLSSQVQAHQATGHLMDEKMLAYIDPWVSKVWHRLEENARQLFAKSHQQVSRQKNLARRRLWLVVVVAAVLITALSIFSIWALQQQQAARSNARQATDALEAFKRERAAKDLMEFNGLETRANTILSSPGGCPADILQQMRQIGANHPDSLSMQQRIILLQQKNPDCK